MTKTVSKFATVNTKTSGVTMVRLPKSFLDKNNIKLKHGERLRIKVDDSGYVISLIKIGRANKHFD